MDNKTILVRSLTQGEKAMSKLSAFVLVATVATAASALPALAQSFDSEVGTGMSPRSTPRLRRRSSAGPLSGKPAAPR
jgi:hypothetical protein